MTKLCKKCNKNKDLSRFDKNRHICKDCRNDARKLCGKRKGEDWRNGRLIYLYGISILDYNVMLEKQNFCCKICLKPNSNDRWQNRLVVDHCHRTGKVRGLLCDKCNRGIGQLNDDIDLLKSAIEYLGPKDPIS